MTLTLNMIRDNPGARVKRFRVGRGLGSGLGKTCGAGQKGQKARTGVAIRAFEGGQMPIYKRLPKRGFVRPFVTPTAEITLHAIQSALDRKTLSAETPMTLDVLKAAGLVRHNVHQTKLLASGLLKSRITIEVTKVSKAALAAVEALGGQIKVTAPSQKV